MFAHYLTQDCTCRAVCKAFSLGKLGITSFLDSSNARKAQGFRFSKQRQSAIFNVVITFLGCVESDCLDYCRAGELVDGKPDFWK